MIKKHSSARPCILLALTGICLGNLENQRENKTSTAGGSKHPNKHWDGWAVMCNQSGKLVITQRDDFYVYCLLWNPGMHTSI